MMKRALFVSIVGLMMVTAVHAQRFTDKLDRGVVAVPASSGNLVSWRMFGEEYYDTKYNLYRGNTKIAGDLKVSNFLDASGNASSTYSVEAVVKGVSQGKSQAVKAWSQQYKVVNVPSVIGRDGSNVTANYHLNDITLADVTGDGIAEFLIKRPSSVAGNSGEKNSFHHYECITMEGKRLWWIDMGPNMLSGPDEQWDMIAYDWDQDSKAEALLIGADNMIIHTSTGKTINIGNMDYVAPRDEYTHQGKEYLIYLNGETGEPYGWDGESTSFTPILYPLPRFEQGEAQDVYNATDAEYKNVWGDTDTGHRSRKHYMAAPYLDGRNPSIFLGRGCYTRHKFCALDVNPETHELTQRWRWNCYDSRSPWFGNGYHNFQIADVDMDGRDEIMFGSMCIDDTGFGLSTTGLGHGDAQHCCDLDPYRWGLEQFGCLEGSEGNSYWNPTTGQIYYRKSDGGDDGRALAGNFTNDYPGGQGRSVSSGVIGLSSDKVIVTDGDSKMDWGDLNMRIYWDGDLCDEILNSPGVGRVLKITKWGNGRIFTSPTGQLNNSSKNNPCVQGDILGDWREEVVVRQDEQLHIYTTNTPTNYGIYTLWHDHQYRNAMAWQCVGYNQPPHPSFFLGEAEGITIAPPPFLLRGRTEVPNGGTITTTDDHLLVSGYEDKTISVANDASPYILTVNAPAWVQGTGSQQAVSSTPKAPARTVIHYTTTLTNGAFSGATRLVKQGEGTLVLPSVVEKHTGHTDVWNGTLQFDGTMESSPVWMNRHTTLISDGGRFMGGLKVEYNSTVYPGGPDKVGTVTASELTLGFGSRVVFDVAAGAAIDQVNADKLTIETKAWAFGPKYKTPVFEFVNAGQLEYGKYALCTVSEIAGNVRDILLEGIADCRFYLSYEDGKVWLNLENLRGPSTVVWNGTADNSLWDLAESYNFLNNDLPDYAAVGDDIVFDDNAAFTTVTVKGAVAPKSITFNNETKAYTLKGDSILGGGPLTKNGAGKVTITNENRVGNTVVNGGTVVVNALANNTGITYGALGSVKQSITLNNGAALSVSQPVITDQTVNVSGSVSVDVPSNMAFTINKGLRGAGAVVSKTGAGTLTTGVGGTYKKLVVKGGRVNFIQSSNLDQAPDTVEFQNGIVWGANMEDGAGVSNRSNFVVPAGKTGTFYGSFRGNYNGKLLGSGKFNVYTGGVRCYWNGDWSQFEGTIIPGRENRQNKKQYEPSFNITNSKGMPKATLQLNEGMSVSNVDPQNSNTYYNVVIGSVTGTGSLTGTGTYYIGGNNANMKDAFSSSSPLVKRGTGYLLVKKAGLFTNSLTIEEGDLYFNDSKLVDVWFTSSVKVKGTGRIVGRGLLTTLIVESGAAVLPRVVNSSIVSSNPGTLKANSSMNIKEGATVDLMIKSKSSYSVLLASLLTINGTVKVTLNEGYTPQAGDSFTLWTASSSFAGNPTLDLPDLPDGLYWDTSALLDKNGVLTVTVDPAGIGQIATSTPVSCEVYGLSGMKLCTFASAKGEAVTTARRMGLEAGTYIVKMSDGRRTETQKVVVK